MASYKLHFTIPFFVFLFINSMVARGDKVALLESQRALSHHIQKISRVQYLLANLTKEYTKDKSLKVCSEVVNEGYRLLGNVQRRMEGVTQYDSDTSSSIQTTFSAASTYLRTCSQTLKEGRKGKVHQYGSLLHHIEDVAVDCSLENVTMGALQEATNFKKNAYQGSSYGLIHSGNDVLSTIDMIPLSRRIYVAQDGSGQFTTISEAIAAAPAGANDYFMIRIRPGRYNENVVVPPEKPFLVFAGSGKHVTVITSNRSHASGYNTWDSATAMILGSNFVAYDIAFENSAGPQGGQAVALLCSANQAVFYRCSFRGYQDTLYAHAYLQFYRDCDIYGTIDFIFGDATAIFQYCHIHVEQPLPGQSNPIVAQQRQCPNGKTGFTIQNCIIYPAVGFHTSTQTYLGRPWGRSTRVAFISNQFNVMIQPPGWLSWNGIPSQVYLGEFNNTGLGASMTGRVAWPGVKSLTQAEAYNMTADVMFGDLSWLHKSRVPYLRGLQ
ncbi:Plant invertase/pectin methylesterase inhibitor superfamily [Rhynchospora pubera]|uniref:Pectinesterase n=1 Tax=Rhynchospora pubera TaxID=906938 RepID=A0AAV8FP52_9POAL|nr:Plant invertase/pectin methylesterase inhibitor superfamily [Rhynchospora pubera]